MSQIPRPIRRQHLLNKSKQYFHPLQDQATAGAARKAIKEKLDEQDREYQRRQAELKDRIKAEL